MKQIKETQKDPAAKIPYQLGEVLADKDDEILHQAPPLKQKRMGYFEPERRSDLLKFHPEIVLVNPQIPQNTGTISRLCAAWTTTLHIIEPMGFEITEKGLKRAGLDYWEHVNLFVHKNWEAFKKVRQHRRFIFIETGGMLSPYQFEFLPGDVIVFGAETFGIPKDILDLELENASTQKDNYSLNPSQQRVHLTLPMYNTGVRSINLSNCVSCVMYLALGQLHGA